MTGAPENATQLDSAIDSILRGDDGPRSGADGELAATARLLRDSLPRLHPRFGFEDLLAARLAAARRMQTGEPRAVLAEPVPLHPAATTGRGLEPVDAQGVDRRRRSLVAGGAIASGVSLALPLAGAAIVAWRRSRSSGGIL